MRKVITMFVVLGLSLSLYANNNASDKYGKDGAPSVRALPDYRAPNGRTEEYELYLTDSYGDGWNGAAVDVFVNGVVNITGATITSDQGDEASYLFDVEDWDEVSTVWTSGSYDNECTYGFYDSEGYLVIESGAGEISFTVMGDVPAVFFSEYAEGSSNNKYLEIYNNTGADYDLSAISISSCSNGCDETGEFDYPDNVTFEAGTVVAAGDVFVIAHPDADAAILAQLTILILYT